MLHLFPRILNRSTRWMWSISSKSQPLKSQEKAQRYALNKKLDGLKHKNITHDEVCDNSLNDGTAVNKMVRSAGNEKRVQNSCGETMKARHLYGWVPRTTSSNQTLGKKACTGINWNELFEVRTLWKALLQSVWNRSPEHCLFVRKEIIVRTDRRRRTRVVPFLSLVSLKCAAHCWSVPRAARISQVS